MANFLKLRLFRPAGTGRTSPAENDPPKSVVGRTKAAAAKGAQAVAGASARLTRKRSTFGDPERATGPSLRDGDDDKVYVGLDPRGRIHDTVEVPAKAKADSHLEETTEPGNPKF